MSLKTIKKKLVSKVHDVVEQQKLNQKSLMAIDQDINLNLLLKAHLFSALIKLKKDDIKRIAKHDILIMIDNIKKDQSKLRSIKKGWGDITKLLKENNKYKDLLKKVLNEMKNKGYKTYRLHLGFTKKKANIDEELRDISKMEKEGRFA